MLVTSTFLVALLSGLHAVVTGAEKDTSPAIFEQWHRQKLDHFDPLNNEMWDQRFYVNERFYKDGGPVILNVGGEDPVIPEFITLSQIAVNYAKNLHAKLILIEHRFYGKSQPTANLSIENLRFLTQSQALADYASFISAYKEYDTKTASVAWIAIGGSYPGAMAAFLRLKYPHLVHGAIASSPSLVAQRNFPEYMRITTERLNTKCQRAIKRAVHQLEELIDAGYEKSSSITDKFRLCNKWNVYKEKDVSTLMQTLAFNIAVVVQHNKVNKGFAGYTQPSITIDEMCDIMTTGHDYLDNYAKINRIAMRDTNQSCIQVSYERDVEEMRDISWDSKAASTSGRQWMWQCCTQLGYWQSSDDENQIFGHRFPSSFLQDKCADYFGPQFDQSLTDRGIEAHELQFGGLRTGGSKIMYISGSGDPWYPFGITRKDQITDPDSRVIFMNGTAHRADLMPDCEEWDTQELREARKHTLHFMREIVRNHRQDNHGDTQQRTQSSLLRCLLIPVTIAMLLLILLRYSSKRRSKSSSLEHDTAGQKLKEASKVMGVAWPPAVFILPESSLPRKQTPVV